MITQRLLGKQGPPGVVMLDLDHFKEINDQFGHGVGDMVLEAVATRWRRCTDPEITLYRMGGSLLFCPRADEGVAALAAERMTSRRRAAHHHRRRPHRRPQCRGCREPYR